MQTVPDPIIAEIFSFLPFSEIIRAESISKKIKLCLEKHFYVLYTRLLKRFNQESISYSHWKNIIKQMNDPIKELQFMPYYTNGGTYGGYPDYYIQNLMFESDYCYCSVNPTNVLVKYALKGVDYNIKKIQERPYISYGVNENDSNIYFEQKILTKAKQFTSQASIHAVVKEIDAKAPPTWYTCPITHFMCFSSLEADTDLGIIERFHGAATIERAKEISNQLGLTYEEVLVGPNRQLVFDNCTLPMQPLCWVELSETLNSLTLPLKAKKLARYFYALLIDARKTNTYDNNIDTMLLLPKGSIIKF